MTYMHIYYLIIIIIIIIYAVVINTQYSSVNTKCAGFLKRVYSTRPHEVFANIFYTFTVRLILAHNDFSATKQKIYALLISLI